MIPYDIEDQRSYFMERSFYVTSTAGLEPQLITENNYETIRSLIMATFSGQMKNRLLVEAGNILFFSTALGFGD